jgi:hypothetical protein
LRDLGLPTCALACGEFERLFEKEKPFKRALESDDEDAENPTQIGKKVKISHYLLINLPFLFVKRSNILEVGIGVYKHKLAFVSLDCSTFETNGKR